MQLLGSGRPRSLAHLLHCLFMFVRLKNVLCRMMLLTEKEAISDTQGRLFDAPM